MVGAQRAHGCCVNESHAGWKSLCLLSPCLGRAAGFTGQSLWKPWEQVMRSLGSAPSKQTWLACGGKAREEAARESLPGSTQLCWAHRLSRTWPLAAAG